MLVKKYKKDSDENEDSESTNEQLSIPESNLSKTKQVNVAPVIDDSLAYKHTQSSLVLSSQKEVFSNLRASDLNAPLQGPFNPSKPAPGSRNTFTGLGQDTSVDLRAFDHEMINFTKSKTQSKKRGRTDSADDQDSSKQSSKSSINGTESERNPIKDPSNIGGFLGSWSDLSKRVKAPSREEEEEARQKQKALNNESDSTNEASSSSNNEGPDKKRVKKEDVSVFHGLPSDASEFLGYPWISPPKSLKSVSESRISAKDAVIDKELMKLLAANEIQDDQTDQSTTPQGDQKASSSSYSAKFASSALSLSSKFSPASQNFIPKKVIQTWKEAEKAVSACRYIPNYGHLLLASSMDSCIRIYETQGKKRCMMTYKGHYQAVRDIDWNPQGTQFVSASYDRFVRVWDAETGKTIGKFDGNALPYCVKFAPLEPNVFLVGQSNRKIVQWDIRTNEITQEYNRHLGAVNSITWIDENRRFVTSSDDKSIRVWEYNIPLDIKYIADPKMHSMPCITMHPNGKYFLCQGLDNKIHVYSTRDKFHANHKKKFTGHLVAGYACNVTVSPDGRCVTSGDSSGNIFFWDWKTCKLLKKIKAHSNVAIDAQWHPLESSRLATAGWDNQLKLWD